MPIQDVRNFLFEFKKIASCAGGIDIVPRQDTMSTLAQLGLTKTNLKNILLGLSVVDYCKGPEDDRDQSGQIWFFGASIDGHDIYIKLKIAQVGSKRIAKCISFHVAQYPLRHPYG